MTTQVKLPEKRWTKLKGITTPLLFLIIAILVEFLVVSYALSLGAKDETVLQYGFKFPGTDWAFTIVISPLFHLVPISVIISLMATWTYLSRHIAVRPQAIMRGKPAPTFKQVKKSRVDRFFSRVDSAFSRVQVFARLGRKIQSIRPSVRSAMAVVFAFLLFTLIVSLLTYPDLIYLGIINAYQSNSSLFGFVKGVANALAPIGSAFSSVNNALLTVVAPGFRDFCLGVGGLIRPLAGLDNVGKYLVIQNGAAWISGLIALFYGEFRGQRYRVKKK